MIENKIPKDLKETLERICEAARGTCHGFLWLATDEEKELLLKYGYETPSDFTLEMWQIIEENIFECDGCGWWYETCENKESRSAPDGMYCKECAEGMDNEYLGEEE